MKIEYKGRSERATKGWKDIRIGSFIRPMVNTISADSHWQTSPVLLLKVSATEAVRFDVHYEDAAVWAGPEGYLYVPATVSIQWTDNADQN